MWQFLSGVQEYYCKSVLQIILFNLVSLHVSLKYMVKKNISYVTTVVKL